jgi:hypothetical protein
MRVSKDRSLRYAVFVGVAAAMACLLSSASAWAGCPHETEASPGFRSYLPDCRAYELVTPPYAGGQPAYGPSHEPPPVSADGEHILGLDFAGFAGAENLEQVKTEFGAVYEFSRTPSGWSTESLEPPASLADRREFVVASADLSRSLWFLVIPSTEGKEFQGEGLAGEGYTFAVREVTHGGQVRFAQVGPSDSPEAPGQYNELIFEGASGDLTHILFVVEPKTVQQFWPGDKTHLGDKSLYEYVGTANREPRLVGVRNAGPLDGATHLNEHAELVSECGTILGSAGVGSAYNAVSTDGSVVYFTALACGGAPAVNELYARIDGAETVDISEPTTGPTGDCELCNESEPKEALFEGASQDGTKVFFLSKQELLPGAKGENLYEYDSSAKKGERVVLVAPEVAGVARISEDGSRVYFVANGVLTEANREGKSPTIGGGKERNLYVVDTVSKATTFVGTLQTEEAEKEALAACKPCFETVEAATIRAVNIWRARDKRSVQATPDGRFLVFPSLAHLTGSEDTSTAPQIFEYDAQEEKLVRVSIGQNGFNNDGNTSIGKDAPRMILANDYSRRTSPTAAMSGLSLAKDGRVFFTSLNVLTPLAVEGRERVGGGGGVAGRENVYEYSEGNVYLVSPGDDAEPLSYSAEGLLRLLGTDQSGSDVFFFTTDSLVPQDTDTQASWYDARVGGGFPAPVSPAGCAGDACRGPLSATPFLPSAGGSETTAGGGNLAPPVSPSVVKPKSLTRAQKLTGALRACKKTPKRKRRSCESQAKKRYGRITKASKSDRRAR